MRKLFIFILLTIPLYTPNLLADDSFCADGSVAEEVGCVINENPTTVPSAVCFKSDGSTLEVVASWKNYANLCSGTASPQYTTVAFTHSSEIIYTDLAATVKSLKFDGATSDYNWITTGETGVAALTKSGVVFTMTDKGEQESFDLGLTGVEWIAINLESDNEIRGVAMQQGLLSFYDVAGTRVYQYDYAANHPGYSISTGVLAEKSLIIADRNEKKLVVISVTSTAATEIVTIPLDYVPGGIALAGESRRTLIITNFEKNAIRVLDLSTVDTTTLSGEVAESTFNPVTLTSDQLSSPGTIFGAQVCKNTYDGQETPTFSGCRATTTEPEITVACSINSNPTNVSFTLKEVMTAMETNSPIIKDVNGSTMTYYLNGTEASNRIVDSCRGVVDAGFKVSGGGCSLQF